MKRTAIKLLSVILTVIMLTGIFAAVPFCAGAQDSAEQFRWLSYSYEDNTLMEIRGYKGTVELLEIPSEIDGLPVKRITNAAFTGEERYKKLRSVTISYGITVIGIRAFQDCIGLENIKIPNSVTSLGAASFENCISLENIEIPDSITVLESSMFKGCTSLKSVTLPESITAIGVEAFSGCTSLESIKIPNVKNIGRKTFENCTSLKNITVPDSVTTIVEKAFINCTELEKIIIPAGVTAIGNEAFSGCEALTIYGYSGTAAEVYANANAIPFVDMTPDVVYGDADGDGVIDSTDATFVLQHYANVRPLDGDFCEAVDVNGDSAVDSSDATFILQFYADVITSFPIEA